MVYDEQSFPSCLVDGCNILAEGTRCLERREGFPQCYNLKCMISQTAVTDAFDLLTVLAKQAYF